MIEVIKNIPRNSLFTKGSVVTIGNFDGFILYQSLIKIIPAKQEKKM